MKTKITLLACLLAVRVAAAGELGLDPLIACQSAKLTASDAGGLDFFGSVFSGLAIDGDTVVVGASAQNSGTGAAYIFERNAGGIDHWGQVKKLTASDGAAGDIFGRSSACLRGDTLVILAPGKNSGTGAAYIFERNSGGAENWGQVKELSASDGVAGDLFGESASLSGDTLVIGAPGTLLGAGAAYVFERNAGGLNNWGQIKKITGSDVAAYDQFSTQGGLSISGDTLVGTVKGTVLHDGVAYVFERNAGGAENWGQVKKVDNGAFNFGFSPSISGDTLAVGAPSESDSGYVSSGAVYVFERNAGGAENWGQVKRLTPSDPGENNLFGGSLFLSGDRLLVGAIGAGPHDMGGAHSLESGEAYVFERNAGGGENWGQLTEFTAADTASGTHFGDSVSFSARTAVVGTEREAAYLFDLNHPPSAVCQNVTKSADGSCQAAVTAAEVDNGSSDPDGDPITLSLSPAGPYPLGTTTVTLTVADNHCGASTCTATVTVVDRDPPLATCLRALNPPAQSNPAAGQSPNGFYQLLARDNCDPAPKVFIQDSASGFLAGPFASGDVVKITQSAHVGSQHAPAPIVAHLFFRGDALLYAVDAAGNVSTPVSCLVPPPPK